MTVVTEPMETRYNDGTGTGFASMALLVDVKEFPFLGEAMAYPATVSRIFAHGTVGATAINIP